MLDIVSAVAASVTIVTTVLPVDIDKDMKFREVTLNFLNKAIRDVLKA